MYDDARTYKQLQSNSIPRCQPGYRQFECMMMHGLTNNFSPIRSHAVSQVIANFNVRLILSVPYVHIDWIRLAHVLPPV